MTKKMTKMTRMPANGTSQTDDIMMMASTWALSALAKLTVMILIWRCDRGPSDILVGRAGECSFDADIRRTTLTLLLQKSSMTLFVHNVLLIAHGMCIH